MAVITHADAARAEIRHIMLPDKFDAQISIEPDATLSDNVWTLRLSADTWLQNPILRGHYIYIDGTEFGGVVEKVDSDSAKASILLTGACWRGMLFRKIIIPPAGQAYYTASGEINTVIGALLSSLCGDTFVVSTVNTGASLSTQWRYDMLHVALETALEANGHTLAIAYDAASKHVIARARPVVDLSITTELSQDYGTPVKSSEGRLDGYNHIIALGAGELTARDVRHLYRLDDGTITQTTPSWAGTVHDLMSVLDLSNPESVDDLIAQATAKLRDYAPTTGLEIDPGDEVDFALGDIVGARDRVTGLEATARVAGKIMTIDKSGVRTETKVRKI